METTKYIQQLAKLSLVLITLAAVSSFFFESSLPSLLQEYRAQEKSAELKTTDWFIFLVILPLGAVSLASLFGLVYGKYWAKSAFIYATIAGYVLGVFLGPVVADAYTSVLSDILSLVTGMIVSLLLFTRSIFAVRLSNEQSAEMRPSTQ